MEQLHETYTILEGIKPNQTKAEILDKVERAFVSLVDFFSTSEIRDAVAAVYEQVDEATDVEAKVALALALRLDHSDGKTAPALSKELMNVAGITLQQSNVGESELARIGRLANGESS